MRDIRPVVDTLRCRVLSNPSSLPTLEGPPRLGFNQSRLNHAHLDLMPDSATRISPSWHLVPTMLHSPAAFAVFKPLWARIRLVVIGYLYSPSYLFDNTVIKSLNGAP
jgi:hypothetical protein